jgi:hypothetical protein
VPALWHAYRAYSSRSTQHAFLPKLSETYIGVKNAGVHFTVVPGKPNATSTVAGILSGWRPWRFSVNETYPPLSLVGCWSNSWSPPWKCTTALAVAPFTPARFFVTLANIIMVEFGPGALFDDHAPHRYVGIGGTGEACDWKPLLTVTVTCGATWSGVAPHAVNISNKDAQKTHNFNTNERFLCITNL